MSFTTQCTLARFPCNAQRFSRLMKDMLHSRPQGDNVRHLLLSAVAAATALSSTAALADSWRAAALLDPSSPLLCRQADVSKVVLEFTQTGNELAVKTAENGSFAVPIAADGFINGAINVPVGARQFAVDLTGNVKDRALQIFSRQYSCRFTLQPTP